MTLTRRQAGAVAIALALAAAAAAAALLDRMAVAVAVLAVTGALLLLALVQVRRRVAEAQQRTGELIRELARELRSRAERAEATQRRLLAAVAEQHREASDRHRAVLETVRAEHRTAAASTKQLGNHLVRRQRDQTREIEALLQLFAHLDPRAPMPSSGHWALNPTDLLQLRSVIDRRQPKLVLELGSGTSSIWMAYAVERHHGRLVSVDHDPDYAAYTRAQLHRHGLAEVATVRDAPLRPVQVDGETYHWYDPAAFTDVDGIDLLVVDGPPGPTGPRARHPALPVLADRLSSHATVVLDDADRPDEREILRRWSESTPGLARDLATIGHLAVLTFTRP